MRGYSVRWLLTHMILMVLVLLGLAWWIILGTVAGEPYNTYSWLPLALVLAAALAEAFVQRRRLKIQVVLLVICSVAAYDLYSEPDWLPFAAIMFGSTGAGMLTVLIVGLIQAFRPWVRQDSWPTDECGLRTY